MNRELIAYWANTLKRQRAEYEKELATLPSGSLSCSRERDGYVRFYWVYTDNDDCYQRIGITKNHELKAKLARKAYLTKAIKVLNKNIANIDKLAKSWIPCSPQAIIASLPKAYRDLSEQDYFHPAIDGAFSKLTADECERIQAHGAWGLQDYRQSEHRPEGLTQLTSFGLRLRSRAEVLIAEKLHEYGIPFRYEQVLQIGRKSYAPDFTFEAADGSEFW